MWSQKKVKMIKDIVCIVFLSKCVQFTSKYTLQTQDTIHCRIFNWYWTTFYHQYLDKKPDPIYFYLYKDLKINTFKRIKENTVYHWHIPASNIPPAHRARCPVVAAGVAPWKNGKEAHRWGVAEYVKKMSSSGILWLHQTISVVDRTLTHFFWSTG